MTEVRDDPREVLALLNSLGFVGITAPQLKAFMKDLKMHRKIKERERQQWKDDTRKKILSKQERMLDEMLRDTMAANATHSLKNNSPTRKSSRHEDPLVKIKVHCCSDSDEENKDKENENRKNIRSTTSKRDVCVETTRSCKKKNDDIGKNTILEKGATRLDRERSESHERRSRIVEASTDSSQYVSLDKRKVSTQKVSQQQAQPNREARAPVRPLSAPEFTNQGTISRIRSKSVASDPTGLANPRNNPSRCSTRSQTKSFIRPWRLQPEAQRAASARKSDPVALYQKYQQEWKQISFPGEEQHARVRWAIREKMLGMDPNPRPILMKSQSLMSIKKR